MFKKILACLLPLITLVSCNNEPKPNPDPNSPLCITCTRGETTLGYFFAKGWPDKTPPPNLEYSSDKVDWKSVEIKDVEYYYPTEGEITKLKQGETVYLRGDNPEGFNHFIWGKQNTHVTFGFTNPSENVEIKIGGNVMSLLSKDNYVTLTEIPCTGCFCSLFERMGNPEDENMTKGSVNASELCLPATTLQDSTYFSTFRDSALTKAPLVLPAVHSSAFCYESMFEGCAFLTTASVINLEDLSDSSCFCMFDSCSNLNITKDKGRTKIFTCPDASADRCVDRMFENTKQEIANPQPGEVFYYN